MREYQLETRARRRNAVRPHVGVEFLDEHDGQPEPLVPDEGMRGARWRSRAAIVGLVALVLIAGAVIHDAGLRATKAPPAITKSVAAPALRCRGIIRVPVGDLPMAIARPITRALPGIRITDAVARVACRVPAIPLLLTRSLDARYKQLLITAEISPGKPPRDTTMQIVASGASNAYIIHDRRRSAHRTVTLTVIAPQRAHIPLQRLQRMADQLARLPGPGRKSADFSRATASSRTPRCNQASLGSSC